MGWSTLTCQVFKLLGEPQTDISFQISMYVYTYIYMYRIYYISQYKITDTVIDFVLFCVIHKYTCQHQWKMFIDGIMEFFSSFNSFI